jgi:hypothetical protein
MASNISNASDYDSGLSGREGFGYSGDTSNTSYVGDDPSGGEIGLGGLFSPSDFAYMDSIGQVEEPVVVLTLELVTEDRI